MKGSISSPENGKNSNNDVHKREEDDASDLGPSSISITVSHGQNMYDVVVPANSTFGHLKLMVTQNIGLDPGTHELLFRGKEKEDDEHLQSAGVKDMSKMLLMEDTTCTEERPVEVAETSVVSRGGAGVAEIRKEVDNLSEQVSALQAVVDGGTKIDDKDIVYVTEMLMRQLLKLDGIEAEGEGKVQRKMEVRRIQSFVETLDILKSKNSNSFSNTDNSVSSSTELETFESGFGSSAGVKDMSKMLLMEDTTCTEERPVEVAETSVVSRGGAAVAEIRKEVDNLSEQVSALQAVVDGGTKIDVKDIVYVTEMLMSQLLKLDGIEAEGEGIVQRKMEVRRIQSFVETLDILKSKNSNPFSNTDNSVSVSTESETFESGSGSSTGVKDMSKMLLMEDTTCTDERPVEVAETSVVWRGGAAVAEIRKEVDNLSEQVSALQAVVDGGTKIDDKDIGYVTEMLMSQLLKLDGIEAEGEGIVQRKMEVRRIQSFVETLDILKSKNSNPFSNTDDSVSVSTELETFESGSGSVNALPTEPSSAKLSHDWEQFD